MQSTAYFSGPLATFFSSSPVSPAYVSSWSTSILSVCVLLFSVDFFFATGAIIARYADAVLDIPSSTIVPVGGVTSIMQNGPVFADSSLLYDSIARPSVVNVVISSPSRYAYCSPLIFFGALRLFFRGIVYNGSALFTLACRNSAALSGVGATSVFAELAEMWSL